MDYTGVGLHRFYCNKQFLRCPPLSWFLWWLSVFMDSYGTCQQTSFFHVPEEGYLVHAKGSGQIYQTLRCSLRFRTQVDKQLCVKFNSFRIDDCSVHFKVFQENQPVNFGRQPSEDCLYVNIPLTLLSSPQLKALVSFSDQNFYVVPRRRRCHRFCYRKVFSSSSP